MAVLLIFQVERPITMKKDGIQTRNRKLATRAKKRRAGMHDFFKPFDSRFTAMYSSMGTSGYLANPMSQYYGQMSMPFMSTASSSITPQMAALTSSMAAAAVSAAGGGGGGTGGDGSGSPSSSMMSSSVNTPSSSVAGCGGGGSGSLGLPTPSPTSSSLSSSMSSSQAPATSLPMPSSSYSPYNDAVTNAVAASSSNGGGGGAPGGGGGAPSSDVNAHLVDASA